MRERGVERWGGEVRGEGEKRRERGREVRVRERREERWGGKLG